jgi:hypothetical protein
MSSLASVIPFPVIPAKTERRWVGSEKMEKWVPAFAGMTGN